MDEFHVLAELFDDGIDLGLSQLGFTAGDIFGALCRALLFVHMKQIGYCGGSDFWLMTGERQGRCGANGRDRTGQKRE